MAAVKPRPPVKLFVAVTYSDETSLGAARGRLQERFGSIDLEAGPIDFSAFTDYYAPEMGPKLAKCFWAFEPLVDPAALADIKLWTNQLEQQFAVEGRRRVNLDPGYVELGKVVLATAKDYAHRVYLQKGIYAEVVLVYRKKDKSFGPVEYTFPDYKAETALDFFNRVRKIYFGRIRAL